MFCNKCGTKNKDDAKFCKECGLLIGKADLSYAGFWIRLGAYFIDFIGVIFLAIVIGFIENLLNIPEMLAKIGILGDYTLYIIYNTFFLSKWSTTPGKIFYGLKVQKENGEDLDFNTSWKRAFLQPLSLLFFGAGYWNMGKNSKQQAWHDKTLKTVVVGKKKSNYIFQIIVSIIGVCLYLYLRSLSNGK